MPNSGPSGKTLVLASSRTATNASEEIAAGLRPRLDYLELAAALGGEVLDTQADETQPAWRRRLERALSSDIAQAQTAWSRRGLYDSWLSTSEKVGLPLAMYRPPQAHVMIAHNLNSARKRQLHQVTGVLRWGFSDIICLSTRQEEFLIREAGLPADRVHRLAHNVDTHFYRPGPETAGDYLLAVGRENRDYPTLIAVARTLGLPTVIVASSLWALRGGNLDAGNLPSNVTVLNEYVSYMALRELYAKARLVVVPLNECAYAAGSTGLLEAMAMGKATVVTRTAGLTDYLTDARTHRAVPPGDVGALAEAIRTLWEDSRALTAIGAAARSRVEEGMSMERYVEGVVAVVRRAVEARA